MRNRKREICTSGSARDEDGQPPHLLGRRKFLHLAACAAALAAVSRVARAQAYPTRPVRIVVGFAAGGSTDIGARVIGQWLQERLGQPFVIENRPGAGTNIATETVVRAPPDGYTLLMVGPSSAVNATLYDKLGFVFLRDIAPVASLIRQPQIMLANPSVMTKTVPELIAYAKANPGKITMASAGVGSAGHLVGELFKMIAGVDFVHVPYRGAGPALADLLGGQVMISFAGIAGSIEYIRSGKLRALAVTTATRSEALPDVPTVSEFVPGFEAGDWLGVGAPKHTPAAIVDKLNGEVATALADPKIRARFADLGGTALALTPAAFGKLLADETEKWAKVIRAAHIKPE
jgi:tripartite-type tricarboxylate transporter receptor subunit TctC